MYSQAEENYLKALFNILHERGEVNVNVISKRLGIRMPTVTGMMKKLAGKGLIRYQSYQPLQLTAKGMKEAGLVIRKHRLTEMFLVEKMGFGWENVHEIAEQIEHIHSPLFFEKMDELLGFPEVDPHGSPIPDKNGKLKWKAYQKLSDCKPGDTVKLCAVVDSSSEFLKFLNKRKLNLGLTIKIKQVSVSDGEMMIVAGKNNTQSLSHFSTEKLLVEKAGK